MVLKLRRALGGAKLPDMDHLIEWFDSEDVADGTASNITLWNSRIGAAFMDEQSDIRDPTKDGELWGDKYTVKLGANTPILRWPSGDAYLQVKSGAATYTVIFVGRSTADGSDPEQVMLSAGEFNYGTGRCLWAIKPVSKQFMGLYIRAGVTSSDVEYSAMPDQSKFAFAFSLKNLTEGSFSLNGTSWIDAAVADGAGDYPLGEGWAFSSTYTADAHSFIGYCRAILVYDKKLDPSELQQIMRYYGVPELPS
jgi:hypothetical protein